ncbi:hypothetical protein E0Z10_g3491 [Xylaria hypoxylon]|uniref:Heterokaryon incompatibility domain-containing protein n=1 Tax=Xylaria hypoxylon TaxID=37992 RepID=A0A4Z0Z1J6_9PEZI|nr:hypothetical protein E0Z10_g3491 [Xylaria hypoxylon]
MRLLEVQEGNGLSLTKVYAHDDPIPPYAILSHTWGDEDDEISMTDIKENKFEQKAAYRKLSFCATQALSDGLRHFWIDTCCINQQSSAELARAINSMFKWYKNAAKCYVYLSDVQNTTKPPNSPWRRPDWEPAFRKSRWFTRGWTLQELIAPHSVEFFSSEGVRLGDKTTLAQEVHQITSIDLTALRGSRLSDFSIEKRMSWAQNRRTKEKEDEVYSLLGLFDVHLVPIYGEGKEKAHRRLCEEIEKLQQPIALLSPVRRTTTASHRKTSTDNYPNPGVIFCDTCSSDAVFSIYAVIMSADEIIPKAKNLVILRTICTAISVKNLATMRMHRIAMIVENMVTLRPSTGLRIQQSFAAGAKSTAIDPKTFIVMDVSGAYGHYKPDCPEEGNSAEDDSEESDSEISGSDYY